MRNIYYISFIMQYCHWHLAQRVRNYAVSTNESAQHNDLSGILTDKLIAILYTYLGQI